MSECVGGVNVSVHLQMFGRLMNLCVPEPAIPLLLPESHIILFSPYFSVLIHLVRYLNEGIP